MLLQSLLPTLPRLLQLMLLQPLRPMLLQPLLPTLPRLLQLMLLQSLPAMQP